MKKQIIQAKLSRSFCMRKETVDSDLPQEKCSQLNQFR